MNFEAAVQRLCDGGVEFVVIGGWAAIFHGSAHVTNDLVGCLSRSKENLRKLAAAGTKCQEPVATMTPWPRPLKWMPFAQKVRTLGRRAPRLGQEDSGPTEEIR
ncbi:MAG: hypothetical protein U0Q16_26285 [Bryobacteraceae bacterium]